MIYDWNGVNGYGHDGATIGQNAYLRIIPDCGITVALLTNGGMADKLQSVLYRELLGELADVNIPDAVFEPDPQPPAVDLTPFVGVFKRQGVVMTVTEHTEYEGALNLQYEVFIPVIFHTLPDGSMYCYIGMRAAPRIS